MNYSRNELIAALKRVYEAFGKDGLNIGEFRDLRDCVEIARACGAFDKKQVTQSPPREVVYGDWLFDEQRKLDEQCKFYEPCKKGDALADIDAGVDDVLDKEQGNAAKKTDARPRSAN